MAVTQDEARVLLQGHVDSGEIVAYMVEGGRITVDMVHKGSLHTFGAPLPGSANALAVWLKSRPHWIEEGWI